MNKQYEAIIRAVNEAFKNNDIPAFLSHCTDDVVWDIVGNTSTQGKDAILQMMNATPGECPDIAINDLFSEGDRSVCTGTFSMTSKEDVNQRYSFCDIYRFEGEKIKAMDTYVVPLK